MQLPECPGPCNPRSRICRRACVQQVASLLEGLPPCIRARLCQEDFATLCSRVSHKQKYSLESKSQNVSTSSEDLTKKKETPKKEPALESKDESSLDEERKEETKIVEDQQEATTQTESTRIYSMASMLVNACSRAENVSSVLKNTVARLARIFSIVTAGCWCRSISAILFAVFTLLLAKIAGEASFYELFWSSQVCGIVAVLGWRISGRVPI